MQSPCLWCVTQACHKAVLLLLLRAGRPTTSAPAPSLAAATLSFEGFCAVLVNVAARLARASPEAMMDNPFLSVGGWLLVWRSGRLLWMVWWGVQA